MAWASSARILQNFPGESGSGCKWTYAGSSRCVPNRAQDDSASVLQAQQLAQLRQTAEHVWVRTDHQLGMKNVHGLVIVKSTVVIVQYRLIKAFVPLPSWEPSTPKSSPPKQP
jgi:hypothetical protein